MARTLPYGADVHDPLFSALHPDNKLFEGLKLEIENRERETRLEFIRRLSSELESEPDLDAIIGAIHQALKL